MTALDGHTAASSDVDDRGLPARSPRRQPSLQLRRQRERSQALRLRLTDTAVIVVAVSVSAFAQTQLPAGAPSSLTPPHAVLVAATTIAVWLLTLGLFGAHEARVMGTGSAEYKRVANATGVAFGFLALVFEIAQWTGLRGQVLMALPVGLVALLVARWRWRAWLQQQRRTGAYTARTLVVGRRRDVELLIGQLSASTDTYFIAGVVLTDGPDRGPIVIGDRMYRVMPSEDVALAAREERADTIVIASVPDDDPQFVRTLSWQLEGTAAELILSSRIADIAGPRISLSPIEGLPLIHVKVPVFEGPAHTLKRLLDLAVSSAACVVVALITPVIALAIRLDSRGPVFFRQQRVGRDGHEFTMYKFRSMTDTAEQELDELLSANEGAGVMFKMKSDPRVTRVGRVLRKYSLDELPQFFNVLKGDMSISGPRPPLPSEVRNYEGRVFRRLYIKPGITGLWQVSGRSDLPWEESVTLDLRYVENWSVALDLTIMWRTVKVMFRPVGAY